MNVLGLDISTTSTGIALPDGTTLRVTPRHPDSFHRGREMRDFIVNVLNLHHVDFVAMEAMGTSMVNTAITIAEVHALVKDVLCNRGIPYNNRCSPKTLKLFATGDGSSSTSKSQMATAAVRVGYAGDGQEDEVDAWWVRAVGLALNDEWIVPQTEYRLRVIEELRKTPAEKKAAKKAAKEAREQVAAERAVKAAERQRLRDEKAAERQRLRDEKAAAKAAKMQAAA